MKHQPIYRTLLLVAAFLITHALVYSQSFTSVISPEYEERLIPDNPNISSLGNFGFNPIDKYTGTANVSIPIHTINLDGLAIPLNLNYNTGGVKVSQESSWAGLGWNLGSGGFITNEINGFDDTKNSVSPTGGSTGNPLGYIHTKEYLTRNHPTYQLEITSEDEAALVTANQNGGPRDVEPDIFTATLFGTSVKFTLDKLGQGETIATANVIGSTLRTVEFDTNDLSFEIVDENGFTYYFDHVEYSTPYVSHKGTYYQFFTEDDHVRQIHEEVWSIHDIEQDRIS